MEGDGHLCHNIRGILSKTTNIYRRLAGKKKTYNEGTGGKMKKGKGNGGNLN